MDPFNEELREQAVHFATEWQWPVLPLYGIGPDGKCSCGKAGCSSPGKHPATPNGLKDATRDPDTIRAWFDTDRPLNLGIATGREAGLAVLDVDERSGGTESLRRLLASMETVPQNTITVETGNGQHFYFRYPEGAALKNSAGKLGPGLDVRGEGGYVVAPPSVHANGKTYEFDMSFEELNEFPAPWLEALNGTARTSSGAEKTAGNGSNGQHGIYVPPPDVNLNPETVTEGGRNNALASMAGKLRHYDFGQGAIEAALLAENERVCRPPLDRGEVLKIARSIVQNYDPEESLIPAAVEEEGEDPADYENTLKVFSFGDLLREEFAPKEILGFHIGKRDIAILQAGTNAGKTTLLRNVALCMAAGRPFEPFYEEGVRPVRVAYFDFESDPPDVQRDMRIMFDAFTPGERELIERNLIVIPKGLMNGELFQFNRHEPWVETLLRKNKVDYIFVDNVSAAYDLTDENSNAEVTKKVIKPLLKLAYKCDAAFLFAHHYGKAKHTDPDQAGVHAGRGASALQALSRTVINMFGDVSKGEPVTVECAKRKTDGGQNYRKVFRLHEDRWFHEAAVAPPPPRKDPHLEIRDFVAGYRYPLTVTMTEIVERFEDDMSVRHIKRIVKELFSDGMIYRPKHGSYCAIPDKNGD